MQSLMLEWSLALCSWYPDEVVLVPTTLLVSSYLLTSNESRVSFEVLIIASKDPKSTTKDRMFVSSVESR